MPDSPEIHETILANDDVAAIVWGERGFNVCSLSHAAQHFPQQLRSNFGNLLEVIGIWV